MKHIVLAITGASGAVYAKRLAECIVEGGAHLHLVVTPLGRRLLSDELGMRRLSVADFVGAATAHATIYPYKDVGAKIASGSFQTHGMIICPCSSNTLAQLAVGLGNNLVTRAATVTMKESRRLIVVHREMPLGTIEIENMLKLARAGAIICPASPGFYMLPQTVGDVVDFVVGRVLDLLEIPHGLNVRWDPSKSAAGELPAAADDAG